MRLHSYAVMKQLGLGRAWLALAICLAAAGTARAQTSLDALEKDLDEVKQEHLDATNQTLTNFLSTLENASASPNAALQLYEQAGGALPDPTQVSSRYAYETPSEKAARLARDQANLSSLGYVAQLHCGLMRFAALFLEDPAPPTLQSDWTTWLKGAAQIYPQTSGNAELRKMTMKDSPISSYLNFHGWGDKDQGGWTVYQLPDFYRQYVLEPLRNPVVADALPAWDTYIAMCTADIAPIQADLAHIQAEESELTELESEGAGHQHHHSDSGDNNSGTGGTQSNGRMGDLQYRADQDQLKLDKWNNEDLPELQFERACDDYTLAPDTEKLQVLVELIKAHPTHPRIDAWIAKVHDLLQSYKASHPGSSDAASTTSTTDTPPATNAPPTTNAPPVTNAPAQ
jgi:hypothetical protein